MKQRIMNNIGFLVALSMLLTFTAASVIMRGVSHGRDRKSDNQSDYPHGAGRNRSV